jgi:hypothetical protein
MVLMQDQHRFNTKAWLLWTAGFVAFIIGGALATAVTGRINDLGSALLGGLVAGAVIGTGQWLVARRLLDPRTWIPATAVAMGIGLANAWVWAAAMPLLWALGWTVTTAGGIDVDRQFAVFGAYGAITFMALSGVLLDRLRAATSPAALPPSAPARSKVMAH